MHALPVLLVALAAAPWAACELRGHDAGEAAAAAELDTDAQRVARGGARVLGRCGCGSSQVCTDAGCCGCIYCPDGTYTERSVMSADECAAVPAGSYRNAWGGTAACAAGKYSLEGAVDGCTDCPRGHHAHQQGSQLCDPCESGRFLLPPQRASVF